MGTRRKSTRAVSPQQALLGAPPPLPPPPQLKADEEPCSPEWALPSELYDMQHSSLSMRQLVEAILEGQFHIPLFQRPYVWSQEQTLLLLDSLLKGIHFGSILVWDREPREVPGVSVLGGLSFEVKGRWTQCLVVDGQQRLASLAHAFTSGRYVYDFQARAFRVDVEPGPDRFPLTWLFEMMEQDHWSKTLAWRESTPHGRDKFLWLQVTLRDRKISFVRIPRQWPLDKVVASYARMANTGTPMDPEQVRQGLERFEQSNDAKKENNR